MHQITTRTGLFVAALIATELAAAGDIAGRYVNDDQPSLTLTLAESTDKTITGTMTDPDLSMPVKARRQDAGFAGTVGSAGETLPFTATVRGDRLEMEIGADDDRERLVFLRAEAARHDASAVTDRRTVIINEKRLTDAELAQAEQTYRIHIPDANYWYDRVLGAWGISGGPTLGFIAPGLDLGGALPPDASGSGTNVFVNGRALHPQDLLALQRITGTIMPGRYFINPQGLAGYEGGPPLWNLIELSAQSQNGGGSNTWQSRITGASGFSDGTTGAVFLPNGGIVSTGN